MLYPEIQVWTKVNACLNPVILNIRLVNCQFDIFHFTFEQPFNMLSTDVTRFPLVFLRLLRPVISAL